MKLDFKSIGDTTSFDTRFTGQYRRLLRNLSLLVLLVVFLGASTVVYFDERLVHDLSRKLIASTTKALQGDFQALFDKVNENLRITIEQLQMTREDDDELLKKLFFRLAPFLSREQLANGILIAEVGTDEVYMILKPDPEKTEFLVWHYSPKHWGENKLRYERWKGGEMLEGWVRQETYDPKTRPWYQPTLASQENELVYTKPYLFFPTNTPGASVSAHWRKHDSGRHFITSMDIPLANVSRITQAYRPTENGMAFVLNQDKRLIGLPTNAAFDDPHAVNAALLDPIDDMDLPVVQAAVDEWEQRGRTLETFPISVEGKTWWAGFEYEEQYPEEVRWWAGILVPESDFIGALSWQRNLALAGIAGIALLLALVLIARAARTIRRDLREAASRVGQKLGPFELVYKIGGGGNGAVYRAKHALLRRPTAVKVMRPEFAHSEAAKQRFEREVQITSSLTHPNTVAVYDFGQTNDGALYYAMEYLKGITLDELVKISGPQPPERVLHILRECCGSLAEAHGHGLIHRDIKPANVMLCERGGLHDVVKVLDFGLVKDVEHVAPDLTRANTLVGTPLYMAPELISESASFSPASDLYALGCVGYWLLTGRNVFEGTTEVEICAMHLQDQPVPPSERVGRALPTDLENLLMRCLAKVPGDRPQNAMQLSSAVMQCEDYGKWTWDVATQWWSDNRSALPMADQEEPRAPLADTHVLLDMDARSG